MKFVYVTPEFRQAFNKSSIEEQDKITSCGQPSYSFVNDKDGEEQFTFEMDSSYYISPPYEFNDKMDNIPFSELMHERAIELRNMDKTIEVVGEDWGNSLILQYLKEVCPKDQIKIPREEKLHPHNMLLVTGFEYNLLFHGLNDMWRDRVRYFLLSQSWQVLYNYDGDWIDINNYQPFYLSALFETWAINQHIQKNKSVSHYKDPPKYRRGNVLAITSEGKVIYKRRYPVKESNLGDIQNEMV
jgi:hypothetical protein